MELSKSAEIFQLLSRGNFLSANSVDRNIRSYYQFLEENLAHCQSLYREVGYSLESGNNYFYLSRLSEPNASIEFKLDKARRWIDLMAFFTTFSQGFTRGFRFSPHDILREVSLNRDLKDQLTAFMEKNKKADDFQEALDEMLDQMSKEGFIELENKMSKTYKVLDAYHYLEQMVSAISICEDEEDKREDAPVKKDQNPL